MMRQAQRGFTLVEAIIVIVIIGVLSAAVAVFIRAPVQSYVDSAGRAEVSDVADLSLRRIARDLRLALPNSIRASSNGDAVELLLTKAGGRYLAAEEGLADGTSLFALDFNNAVNVKFTVVGGMPTPPPADALVAGTTGTLGDYVAVYNLGQGFAPADAYKLGNIAQIRNWDYTTDPGQVYVASITLWSNPFAAQDPPMPSPTQRFQVVSGPVMYYCNQQSGTLSRYWHYGITSAIQVPPTDPFVQSAVIADHVADCSNVFKYTATNQRTGLVTLSLALKARNDTDPSIRLVHQIHVDNTP